MADRPKVRFAPSPTGYLHIGNIRTAVLNWLFARRHGGTFLLRLDDTDRSRSREEFAAAIREDLDWLGLDRDGEVRQSARFGRYDEVVAALKQSGRLYPCFETPEELERRRKRQLARGLPPVYDGAALRLTAEERARLEAEGRRPHWRFRLDAGSTGAAVTWSDLIRGEQTIATSGLSDPVLVREDGAYLYTLSSVIDDIDFGISHVIRGEDHVTNTAVQIRLFEALGAAPPAFAHHSLLVGAHGEALSKRLGALSIRGLREDGLEPLAVAILAARIGTSDPVAPVAGLGELAAGFDFGKLARAPAHFVVAELKALNGRLLHGRDISDVADRLAAFGVPADERFWLAVRGNLDRFADVRGWWQVVAGEIAPVVENAELTRRAAGLLPDEPWDESTWPTWTARVKQATGLGGKALFHPLRLALTGAEKGPELRVLMPLIGRARALARLEGRTA